MNVAIGDPPALRPPVGGRCRWLDDGDGGPAGHRSFYRWPIPPATYTRRYGSGVAET